MSPRSHESWKEQLPSYLLGALSPGEKADVEHHLGGCAECQAELRWLEPAKERLAEQVKQVEPSPALKSRLCRNKLFERAHADRNEACSVLEPQPFGLLVLAGGAL